MKQKTFVYIGQFIPPNGNAEAQRVYSNAKLLRRLGYKVVLIGCKKGIEKTEKEENTEFETYVTPYPFDFRSWASRCVSVRDYFSVIDAVKQKDDIVAVISCDLQCIAQRRLRNKLKKLKIAYIEDTIEWIRKTREKSLKNTIKDINTFFRMRFEHIKTKNLICISKFLYDYYQKRNCTVVKIPVLIDFNENKWEVAEQYTPNKIRTIAYAGDAGSIGYKERLDRVVEEACKLYDEGKPLSIEMVGVTKEEFAKQCPEISDHVNFEKVAVFYGRQSHEFCLEKIAKADASVLIRENSLEMQAGFPTKLSESLRLGTPPLVTMIGDYDAFINPGKDCISLKDTSNEEVREALLKLYDMSDEELMNMHKACKSNRAFDYRSFENEMKDFVEKLIGKVG